MTDLTIASCYLGLGSFHFNHFKEMAFPEPADLLQFLLCNKAQQEQASLSGEHLWTSRDARPQELLPWSWPALQLTQDASKVHQREATAGIPQWSCQALQAAGGLVNFCFHIKISLFTYLCSLGAELWENGKFFWGVPRFFWASKAVRPNILFLLQPISSA